jgi:ribosomal protein L34
MLSKTEICVFLMLNPDATRTSTTFTRTYQPANSVLTKPTKHGHMAFTRTFEESNQGSRLQTRENKKK